MIVILINLIATFLLCLYIASGEYVLFEKHGLKNLFRHFGDTGTLMHNDTKDDTETDIETDTETDTDTEIVVLKRKSVKEALTYLLHNKSLWIFAVVVMLTTTGFYVFREYQIVVAPFLNLKYTLLLFVFFAVAVIDAHYSVIPNHIVVFEIGMWVVLITFSVIFEQQSVWKLIKFSGIGALFGGGVLLACRILMKNSMGFGDIKFLAVVGMICGFYKTFNILFYSLFVLFFVGIYLLITKKADRHSKLPMGPFFLLGYIIADMVGM